jgi:hypothetical protein
MKRGDGVLVKLVKKHCEYSKKVALRYGVALFLAIFLANGFLASPALALSASFADDLVRIALRWGDDVARIAGRHGDEAVRVITRHGKKAVQLVKKHGDDAARFFANHGDDGVRLLSRYGDDALRLSPIHQARLAKMSASLADDAMRLRRLYGDKILEAFGRYGKKASSIVHRSREGGASAGQVREFIEFICEYGERGILFIERHWKTLLGGVGVYALWKHEQGFQNSGKTGPITKSVNAIAFAIQAVMGFLVLLVGGKVFLSLLATRRNIRSETKKKSEDGAGDIYVHLPSKQQ